ncbi:sugar phosphate isomerase/epimerase family protein [Algoriphagus machipongonensis]|uniref:Probable IolI protein n=1 Tax=Algoriphagus machipongonensis TaxID=388413 RepID=A3HXC0_9BACT|nr:sugar phosphate isomerase/epimerase [Algoriphagus machipongonensis]EAZ81243.1 probable IolI protein [Algoriphagus machipongonensis]
MKRRNILKSLALAPAALAVSPTFAKASELKNVKYKYSLNTSTIRGQKLSLSEIIETSSKAGYDGLEIWISEIETYLGSGKSLSSLKTVLSDAKQTPFNAIGFAPWMAQDPQKSKQGFAQMEKEMGMLADIGCTRIAAPAIGAEGEINVQESAEKYSQLIDLGKKIGVMPQLEFWGAFGPFHNLSQCLSVAVAANNPDTKILPDVYHLFRGGSGFNALKLLSSDAFDIIHVNDVPSGIAVEDLQDKDRVYPGDGIAPYDVITETLGGMSGTKILSLELFNPTYYQQDALEVAKTGLKKTKEMFL